MGDAATASWSNTPEGFAMFVHSCLGTVPAVTQENTTTVPLYTPTPFGDKQNAQSIHGWGQQAGEYKGADGEGYQLPRDWLPHAAMCARENRLLPDPGSVILPETSPLTVHQWQDMPAASGALTGGETWQEPESTWSTFDAECMFSTSPERRAYEWGLQHGVTAQWSECMMEEEAITSSLCWNVAAQQIGSHEIAKTGFLIQQDYMKALDGCSESPIPQYLQALDGQTDSCIPEYMPAVDGQYMPAIHALQNNAEETAAPAASMMAARALPLGVEVALDVEPPPLSPQKVAAK
jgi:hypothetical protein